MIIRLSVNDNDYTEELEKFALSLNNLIRFLKYPTNASLEEMEQAIERKEKINQILNQDTLKKYATFKEISWLENVVVDAWKEYLLKYVDANEGRHIYDALEVDIRYYFVESDENGEAVYYFTKTGRFITQ